MPLPSHLINHVQVLRQLSDLALAVGLSLLRAHLHTAVDARRAIKQQSNVAYVSFLSCGFIA